MAYTTIDEPTIYFNTKLYTGNGGTNAITGVGFQPDWVWLKRRDSSAAHYVWDVVRGAATQLYPASASSEDAGQTNGLSAFGSDGFTLGSDAGPNANSGTYASWNWKAGDSNTSVSSSGSGNGAINACTHRANTTAGFSIIKYTGLNSEISNGQQTKVTHGLGVKPDFLIMKNKDSSSDWIVTRGTNNDDHLNLNNTDAASGSLFTGNQNQSDSTHFVVGNEGAVNANGDEFIAYVFAEKKGFSKFGTYTGNGNANGTFVYTGFKPAWTLIKRTDSSTGGSWILFDNKRGNNVINPVDVVMAASNNQSESDWGTAYDCDYLSNGFKWRYNGAAGYNNTSGATYIYMAFAESPFTNSNGVPNNAR